MISIIIAIDSDGTENQQNIVTNSLKLEKLSGSVVAGGRFEQDSINFQLYHYIFSPLNRSSNGQYIIYSGIKVVHTICMYVLISYVI